MSTETVDVLKEKRVIVVDDDPDFLFQQEQILKNAGCEVLAASTRKDAEKLLRKEKADAVILDLMIDEDDDGFVLAYKAKKANPEMPV
ncbi:MAG: response regulator, partial [Planctomycetota bacterium]